MSIDYIIKSISFQNDKTVDQSGMSMGSSKIKIKIHTQWIRVKYCLQTARCLDQMTDMGVGDQEAMAKMYVR